MTLYEVNKMAYQNIPPITDIQAMQRTVMNFLNNYKSRFYMLLNNENHYYTIFVWKHNNNEKKACKLIVEIATELGPIKDIVQNDDTQALEFWIDYNGEPTLFVLFDYAKGVVEID